MKKLLLTSIITGLFASVAVAAPVFAWHPEGVIIKKVQNVTTGGAVSDANTATTAVTAKPGDTLKYVIEISNPAKPANNSYNDLAHIVLTDTLPTGVELVSAPTQRVISENINGIVVPGSKVVREYTVKVTSTKDGDLIDNKACFTGDSIVKDSPKKGCDNAIIKVSVPPVVPPVTPPTTPETPKTPPAPVVLPATGTGTNIALFAIAASVIGYFSHQILARRSN